MGVGKWLFKGLFTGGLSWFSPKSGVTAKGQRKRGNKQLKKQTELLKDNSGCQAPPIGQPFMRIS